MPTTTDRDDCQQRQCRRGASADVELHAAMALADMAGVEHAPLPAPAAAVAQQQAAVEHEDEELASTRLSLELGNVAIHSSPCSSSSSGAGQQPPHAAAATATTSAAVPGYGPSRPRTMLTEAEKEAKRLRRVLANRESARQTILRRQAIRDELARKVADLASQNENMKKEKDMVLEQYLSLKETNKQLKQQVAKTTKKKPPSSTTATTPMDISTSAQQHAEASPPPTPPQPSFLYSGPPPTMPVPYVWGSWPPCGPGPYEHAGLSPAGHAPPPLCLPPACAWYYPVVAAAADPRGSPPSYVQPFQELAGSPCGAGECTDDDDPACSLTLAIDAADKRSTAAAVANAHQSSGAVAGAVGLQVALSGREKAATAAEARKRRKELTKLKQMHAGSRHGAGDHW